MVGSEQRKGHSILKLIVDPIRHDGESVITAGFLMRFEDDEWHPMNGCFFLYPSKEYSDYDKCFSLIVVSPNSDAIREKLEKRSGNYVVLEGVFEAFDRASGIITAPPVESEFGSGKLLVEEILDRVFYYQE